MVFNTRIVKLMEYAEQLKARNKKRDRTNKLESKLSPDHPELRQAVAEEDEVYIYLTKKNLTINFFVKRLFNLWRELKMNSILFMRKSNKR